MARKSEDIDHGLILSSESRASQFMFENIVLQSIGICDCRQRQVRLCSDLDNYAECHSQRLSALETCFVVLLPHEIRVLYPIHFKLFMCPDSIN